MKKRVMMAWLAAILVTATAVNGLFGFFTPRGRTVTVPTLVGGMEDAELPGWATVEASYRYSETVPAGVVMEQSPQGGSRVKVSDRRGCVIALTVSLGAERREVPSVAGLEQSEAVGLLRERGFAVRVEARSGGQAGRVLSTSPVAGSLLKVGSTVTLTVWEGTAMPTVELPRLVGYSRATALLELFRLGLGLLETVEEPSELPEGTVIRQSPEAGSLVPLGTRIRLTVASPLVEGGEAED